MPRVGEYELPVDDMQQVAAASGLQWVNSDASKVAAAQAAIAAEPAVGRAPRERAPAPTQDEAPLMLVETRRDLRDVSLPFDQPR
jgi:ribonuclease E